MAYLGHPYCYIRQQSKLPCTREPSHSDLTLDKIYSTEVKQHINVWCSRVARSPVFADTRAFMDDRFIYRRGFVANGHFLERGWVVPRHSQSICCRFVSRQQLQKIMGSQSRYFVNGDCQPQSFVHCRHGSQVPMVGSKSCSDMNSSTVACFFAAIAEKVENSDWTLRKEAVSTGQAVFQNAPRWTAELWAQQWPL